MATRKLVRDVFKQLQYRHISAYSQGSRRASRFSLLGAGNGNSMYREFSVLSEFPKKIKDEINSIQEFQQTFKELKEKMEELKGVKDDLKVRTKQTAEELYKHVDGAWTEAEATAKKVTENVKEKVSAAKEEVKETLGTGKQEFSSSANDDDLSGKDGNDYTQSQGGDDNKQQSGFDASVEIAIDLAKKGYGIVKDELGANPSKRKRALAAYYAASQANVERSTRTDLTIVPQSEFSKWWESFKEEVQDHPVFKQLSDLSEPFVTECQQIADDIRESWETSEICERFSDTDKSFRNETDAAMSFKEIRRRDPYFDLPDFVSDVQEMVKPVLKAYINGDIEVLEKYCFTEIVERCKAERKVCETQGTFYDNKILFISDVHVKETKMMGDSPIIVVQFAVQMVHCVRDKLGEITEGGQDTICSVHYLWAMQLAEAEEGCHIPIWKLRDMQQEGIQALLV